MRKLGILLAVLLFGIVIYAQQVDLEGVLNRLELLEEYANMIYETVGTKVSSDELELALQEFDSRISELEVAVLNIQSTIATGLPALRSLLYELSQNLAEAEERLTKYVDVRFDFLKEELETLFDELSSLQTLVEDIRVTLDIHDSDILKIFETLGTLSEEITNIKESIAMVPTLANDLELIKLKLDMYDHDIVNIYDNLATKVDLESFENLEASFKEQLEMLLSRLELLEEYTNMMYDTIGTKLSIEEFEVYKEELEARLSEIEVAIINIQSTLETGLPAIRSLLYELSDKIVDVEARVTTYTDIRVDALREEAMNEISSVKESVSSLRNTTNQKVAELEEKIKAADNLAQLARSLAILGIFVGIVGILLPYLK